MRRLPALSIRLAVPALIATLAACGGGGGTEPPSPSSIAAVTANPLPSAAIGTVVATAPAFEVRDARGRPLAGIAVSVAVTAGGGTLAGAPTTTVAGPNPIGQWTLGTVAGPQTVTVNAASLTPLVFTLDAQAGAPTQLAIEDGDDQFGTQGQPVPAALRVRVRDQFNNPVAGAVVGWAVDAGSGTLAAATSTSNAQGIATAPAWTLGPAAEGEQAVVASLGGLTARFTATPQRAPATITIETAPPGTATVFTEVAAAFAVRDSGGVALQGVPVTVLLTQGNGQLTGAPTLSALGTTSVGTWRLGTTAGTQSVTVSVAPHVTPVVFSVVAQPGPPATMQLVAGATQSALAGAAVPTTPRVRLIDQFGNAIAGATVNWAITAGGGTLTGPTAVPTDAGGFANGPAWTLGRRGGPQSLLASVNAVTAIFSASIQTAFNIDLRFSGTPPTGAVFQAFQDAAARITAMIVDDIPAAQIGSSGTPFNLSACGQPGVTGTLNEVVDDVVIYAVVVPIDGVGQVLGAAGPCLVRTTGGLTGLGTMRFDSADLDNLAANGRLNDIITHEMLHVIGIGTIWSSRGILTDTATTTPKVIGPLATAACVDDHGGAGVCPGYVPAENCLDLTQACGAGTRFSHWKESIFRTELMTGFSGATNPLSKMTVQNLADLGYGVNTLVADPYTVPPPTLMALLTMEGDVAPAQAEVRLAEPLPPRFEVDRGGRVRRIVR